MSDGESECYAIIPAAGRSRRMGQSKLMLPWPTDDRPAGVLIDAVLNAWTLSCVKKIVVVVRDDDESLAAACAKWPVTLLRPKIPPMDMKESVQLAVQFLNDQHLPTATGRCFIGPADLPGLTHHLVDRLAGIPYDSERIVVPLFGARQGHPALLPWAIMAEIFTLSEDEGIDQIVMRHPRTLLSLPTAEFVDDVDTLAEYEAALKAAKIFHDG